MAVAVAGLFSLLFIPGVVRFGSGLPGAPLGAIDAFRREIEEGDPTAAEARLVSFLAANPPEALRIEATLLLARATLARGRAGLYPGVKALQRAGSILSKAAGTPEFDALRAEVAAQFLEYGRPREAAALYKVLYGELHDPDLALSVARSLIRLAEVESEARHDHLDQASARVSDALRAATPDRRVRAVRVEADLYRGEGRAEELLTLLARELAETRNPADRGLLQLERGRTFARLGRNMEALAAFDEAERLIPDPLLKGMALVHQAELFVRSENPEGVEMCKRIQVSGSPATPYALIVLGVHDLKSRLAAGLDELWNGFSQIRRPRAADEAGFDPAWAIAALRASADRETDPDRLSRHAAVFGEIVRLQPLVTRFGFDQAALLLRARRYEAAADRFQATADSERAEPEERERALLAAADACAEGGLQLRAAALYKDYYESRPASNSAGLFHRAASLKRAGDAAGAIAGFENYVATAGPSGTYAGTALIEKAALLGAADRWPDALTEIDRVLKARDVATAPDKDDWAQALLARGRALLRLHRPVPARKSLEEYLERYAEGAVPTPASLEAAGLLVEVAIEERQWQTGLERLRLLETFAGRLSDADKAPYAGRLQEARFLEGDLHFSLGDYAAAYRAYGDAVKAQSSSEDRLRGLIGRARASARLERLEEARKDYTSARAILEQGAEPSSVGHGKEYWEVALEALAREVR
jgi:hypothetical protein